MLGLMAELCDLVWRISDLKSNEVKNIFPVHLSFPSVYHVNIINVANTICFVGGDYLIGGAQGNTLTL